MQPGLDRFVAAQEAVWPQVSAELQAGAVATHWMWFVFPRLRALGRNLKLRSSMTLFAAAAPDEPLFHAVLDRFDAGVPDPRTLALLAPSR